MLTTRLFQGAHLNTYSSARERVTYGECPTQGNVPVNLSLLCIIVKVQGNVPINLSLLCMTVNVQGNVPVNLSLCYALR